MFGPGVHEQSRVGVYTVSGFTLTCERKEQGNKTKNNILVLWIPCGEKSSGSQLHFRNKPVLCNVDGKRHNVLLSCFVAG